MYDKTIDITATDLVSLSLRISMQQERVYMLQFFHFFT